jgi:hypothetical protein
MVCVWEGPEQMKIWDGEKSGTSVKNFNLGKA